MRSFWLAVVGLLAACGDGLGPSGSGTTAALVLGSAHVCQIIDTGTRCWGRGLEGQLGIGSAPADAPPTRVVSGPTFVSLAAGATHTCGLDADGAAWCWGSNDYGELGTAPVDDERCQSRPCRTSPAAVVTTLRFRALAAGLEFTCGLATDGTVDCWGLNDLGQLGTRADASCGGIRCSPAPIAAGSGVHLSMITAGTSHVCGIDPAARAICWGYMPDPGAHPNGAFLPDTQSAGAALRFASLAAGGYHTCGVARDGRSYCWGIDAVGAGPDILQAHDPAEVSGGHRFSIVRSARYTSCGLDATGRAYCWGPDIAGELGTGDPTFHGRQDEPVAIVSPLRFTTLAGGGSNYCATTAAGVLYCWGHGTEAELGQGHEDSAVPVPVP